jgi:hypothetical protein
MKYFGTWLHKLERCFCEQGILVTSDLHGYAVYINISFDSSFICLFLILTLPFVLDVYVLDMRVHSLNSSYAGL